MTFAMILAGECERLQGRPMDNQAPLCTWSNAEREGKMVVNQAID